tara:strand:+ start:75 stop:191 length:117 start_codon:yes stop_codon:yes gene_type:complete
MYIIFDALLDRVEELPILKLVKIKKNKLMRFRDSLITN